MFYKTDETMENRVRGFGHLKDQWASGMIRGERREQSNSFYNFHTLTVLNKVFIC